MEWWNVWKGTQWDDIVIMRGWSAKFALKAKVRYPDRKEKKGKLYKGRIG